MDNDLTCPISLEIFNDPVSTPCCGNAFSRLPLKAYLGNSGGEFCPLCRANIKASFPEFDIEKVPTNRTISSLVDLHQTSVNGDPRPPPSMNPDAISGLSSNAENKENNIPRWKCHKTPLISKSGLELPIDHLEVEVEWPSYEGEVCMFLPVIDQSGSMSGKPFEQVKEALMHMLHQTMAHRSVFTCIIPYSSAATSIRVPRDGNADTERWAGVQQRVKTMKAGGGTSFANAFSEIKDVIFGDTRGGRVRAQAFPVGSPEYEEQRRLGRLGMLVQGAPAFVTSIAIVFMTDGQDSSFARRNSYGRGRMDLVDSLKDILKEWKKEVVVHTVGFSRNHDFDFLDELRKVGTKEGMFRYADPSDGDDALCSKLSELTDSVVAQGGAFPVKLALPPHWTVFSRHPSQSVGRDRFVTKSVTMEKGQGSLSVFLNKAKDDKAIDTNDTKLELSLSIPSNQCPEQHQFQVLVHEEEEEDSKKNRLILDWEAFLCSEIAQEALELGQAYKDIKSNHAACSSSLSASIGSLNLNAPNIIAFKLHAALLLQRTRCLEAHVKVSGDLTEMSRLELCSGQIANMLQGKDSNAARLNDASFTQKPTATVTVTPPPPPDPVKPTKHSYGSYNQQRIYRNGVVRVVEPKSDYTYLGGTKKVLQKRQNKSILHKMVLSGNIETLKNHCVKAAEEVLMMDDKGDSPLCYAAMIGRLKAAEVLLNTEGCAPMIAMLNKSGLSPLEVAARRGHWKTVQLIYSVGGAAHITDIAPTIQSALNSGYFHTAATLAALGVGGASPHMLQGRVPSTMLEQAILASAETEFARKSAVASSTSSASSWGNGYLKRACENGMLSLVTKCIAEGIRPSSTDEAKEMLTYCGVQGDPGAKIADMLLKCHFESSASSEGAEVLSLGELILECAEKGWVQLLEVLLHHASQEVNHADPQGTTPLLAACTARKMECLILLLKANANPSLLDENDRSPLMASIDRNHCAAVALLLSIGAPLTYTIKSGKVLNVLNVCCETERPEILEIILKHCDKTIPEDKKLAMLHQVNKETGLTLLMTATKLDDANCVKVLLSHGCDIMQNTRCDHSLLSQGNALHLSVLLKTPASAFALLESGLVSDINCTDGLGRTALHLAVIKSSLFLVRLLRNFGIDVYIKDQSGKTASAYIKGLPSKDAEVIAQELLDPALLPLLEASRCVDTDENVSKCCSIVELKTGIPGYLSGSLCLDIHGGDGWTPLMEALCVGNFPFARSLVAAGADMLKCDERGLSSLFWAQALHGKEAARSLLTIAKTISSSSSSPSSSASSSSLSSSSSLEEEFKRVVVKGGEELIVSKEAFHWMEQNFPVAAAQAFALSALKLALIAQGFVVYESTDSEWVKVVDEDRLKQESMNSAPPKQEKEEQKHSSCFDIDALIEDSSFQKLFKSVSEEDTSLLNTNFAEMLGLSKITDISKSPFSDHFSFEIRMRNNGDLPQFKSESELMAEKVDFGKVGSCVSVLGFMQDVADSRTKWPRGASAMALVLNHARIVSIGAMAFISNHSQHHASPIGASLTFADCFVLSLFAANSDLYTNINKSLNTGNTSQVSTWMPLIGSFVRALMKVPTSPLKKEKTEEIVYMKLPSDFIQLLFLNSTRPTVYWKGFLATTSSWSCLFNNEDNELVQGLTNHSYQQAAPNQNQVILRIISKSGHSLSMFSSSPSNAEVIFLPQTCFRIVSVTVFDHLSPEMDPTSQESGGSVIPIDQKAVAMMQKGNKKFVVLLEEQSC